MIVPVTPDELAKALLPGLKAITMQSMEMAVLDAAKRYMQDWVRQSFATGTVKSSVSTDGKLVFLIELDPKEMK